MIQCTTPLSSHSSDLWGGLCRLFYRLEKLGQKILQEYKKPSLTLNIYHTVMCWAGCDRLSKIANKLGLTETEEFWQKAADDIKGFMMSTYWDDNAKCFTSNASSNGVPTLSRGCINI